MTAVIRNRRTRGPRWKCPIFLKVLIAAILFCLVGGLLGWYAGSQGALQQKAGMVSEGITYFLGHVKIYSHMKQKV